MKKIALKTYGKILAIILSFFGLSSCDITEPRVEYGTPSADYIVKGKISDKFTNQPIKGIGVIVPSRVYLKHGDTVYTNELGEYTLDLKNSFPYWNEKMKVIAKDLDAEKNGIYEKDSIELTFSEKDLVKKGTGNWYDGVYEKTNQNFKLLRTDVIPLYGVMQAAFKEEDKK